MENDRRKKKPYNYTTGRISQKRAADYFDVSEKTINTNLKNSNAKRYRNEKEFPKFKFKNKLEFGQWLLQNMDTVLDGQRIDTNIKSYFPKYKQIF
jgi:hypothetical protein